MALDPGPTRLGVAWLEPTTGEFSVAEWEGAARFERLRDEHRRDAPARARSCRPGGELPAWLSDPQQPEGRDPARARSRSAASTTSAPAASCSPTSASRRSRPSAARRCRARRPPPARRCATCARRRSATSTHVTTLVHPRRPGRAGDRRAHAPQPRAGREPGRRRPRAARSLDVLDHTRTAMGGAARCASGCCARWSSSSAIQDRLDAVEELAFRALERGRLREALGARPGPRPHPGPRHAGHRRARATWSRSPPRCARCPPPPRRSRSAWRRSSALQLKELDPPLDVADGRRAHARAPSRPRSLREGGFVRDGVDPELDELRAHEPRRARDDRGDRGARARAHRDRLAQGPLQPRLRLLHRGQPARTWRSCPPTTCASRRSRAASASSRPS